MLKWIKSLFKETITADELAMATAWRSARHGRPFFREPGSCPFGQMALKNGVLSVVSKDVRHDN